MPARQARIFACPECKDTVFQPVPCVKLVYDRLDPDQELRAAPVSMMSCLRCKAWITRDKTGKWIAVHTQDEPPDPSDGWKKVE